MNLAIISAAGWKGAGRDRGYLEYPEPFLPLMDGTTTLSRTAGDLTRLGFDVYIAIGSLGYPFHRYWPKYWDKSLLGRSPWTEERLVYVETLGTPIQIDDPGHRGSHDTFCGAIETLPHWERLFLARGDILLPPGKLDEIVEKPWPSQYQLCPNHAYFLLNQPAAAFYLEYMEPFRKTRWGTRRQWWGKRRHRYLPDGHWQGTLKFEKAGIPKYSEAVSWVDIDSPATYESALNMVERMSNV